MFVIQNTATKMLVGPKNAILCNPLTSTNYRGFSKQDRANAALRKFKKDFPELQGLGEWEVVYEAHAVMGV